MNNNFRNCEPIVRYLAVGASLRDGGNSVSAHLNCGSIAMRSVTFGACRGKSGVKKG